MIRSAVPRAASGFTLIEVIFACFIGLIAMSGMLYLYKSQHAGMVARNGLSDASMNGRFTLNEAQYYLMHAGMGLPAGSVTMKQTADGMVVMMNRAKRAAPG